MVKMKSKGKCHRYRYRSRAHKGGISSSTHRCEQCPVDSCKPCRW